MALIRQEAARPRSLRIPRAAKHAGNPRVPELAWPPAPREPSLVLDAQASPLNRANRQILRNQLSENWQNR